MEFRHRGQRDDRRRRVLTDETTGGQLAAASSSSARRAVAQRARSAPRYTDAALPCHQPRITDFIPVRPISQAALLFLVLGVAALCFALDRWSAGSHWAIVTQLTATGTLSGWLTGIILLAAAVWCLLVYLVRRHKIDDYNGRYRVWLWASAGSLLASFIAAVPIGEAVGQSMASATDYLGPGEGLLWWIIPVGSLGGILVLRLAWDMRECRTGCAAMLLAGLLAAGHVAMSAGLWHLDFARQSNVLGMLPITATLAYFWSLAFYSRHVLLDAQGLLAARKSRKASTAKAKKSPPSRADDLSPAGDETPSEPESPSRRAESVSETSPSRLSKTERRRLRKQRRQAEAVTR